MRTLPADVTRLSKTSGVEFPMAPSGAHPEEFVAKAISTPTFERHGLSDEQLTWMLHNMYLQRMLDNRGFQLNRQGKIPFATGSEGHEGIHAGTGLAFARGRDILAACGQLKSETEKLSVRERQALRAMAMTD